MRQSFDMYLKLMQETTMYFNTDEMPAKPNPKTQHIPIMNLSAVQAAHYLGISKCALDKASISGDLFGFEPPAFVRMGRAIRYPIKDLNKWLEELNRFKTIAQVSQFKEGSAA